jgi:hypothetical protein
MTFFWRHLSLAAGVSLVVLAARQEVRAQFIQPGFRVRGPLSINQAAFNAALTGQVHPGVSPVSQFPFANPLFNPFANPIANPLVNPALNPAIDPRALRNFFSPGAAFRANPLINPFTSPATNPTVAAALSGGFTDPLASTLANPYAGGVSPYGGADPYGSSYYETPIGGFLRGTADIVSSQGKWMESLQRADLSKEQVRQAKLATRGKSFDEYFYERRNTPTFEQEREFFQGQQLMRSLNNPPESEVWSGQALNDLLADLAKSDPDKAQGPNVPLDEDMLRHLNLTPAKGNANAGLLKNDARLTWPLALRDDDSKTDRASVNSLAAEAVHQAVNGRVDAGTLKELSAAAGRLRQRLAANVGDLTANQYAEANHFLGDLDDAIRALGRPDAGDYFTRKYAAQGKDVAELVKGLTARGLRFAPATVGDEAAYLAVHRALATYDQNANTRLARETKPDATKPSAEDSREKPREERPR